MCMMLSKYGAAWERIWRVGKEWSGRSGQNKNSGHSGHSGTLSLSQYVLLAELKECKTNNNKHGDKEKDVDIRKH